MNKIGIIMNGVTGRMGTNQHLIRSIKTIRDEGGIKLKDGSLLIPDPVLVGRNKNKLRDLAKEHNVPRYTTDLNEVLEDPRNRIYFDSSLTELRDDAVRKAIAAKKAIYCEKPVSVSTSRALSLHEEAKAAGIKNGVVQDKLWLPGLLKLQYLIATEFFGKIHSVKGDFGYWVFDGKNQPAQRPSWNYRRERGGGIMLDMFCHWRYIIDNLFGEIESLTATGAIHIPERVDEQGQVYETTSDDAAYAIFRLKNGIICQFNSSWCTRVRRDDLLTIQVDGSKGSAVAGLRECFVQHDGQTPKPIWNPDVDSPGNFFDDWTPVPTRDTFQNAFKIQWELFLRHVVEEQTFPWDLKEGVKGVQLAELGMKSWEERRWVDVPGL